MVAVLFTQLAIAAYSCPASEAVADDQVTMATEMPDCHGMGNSSDPSQPQLCKAHCSNEAQSSARALSPDLQPNPASMALLVRLVEPPAPPLPAQASWRAPPWPRTTDSLPLYLSLHVLRN